jgi:hypothetical protein
MDRRVVMAVGGVLHTGVFELRRDIGRLGGCMVAMPGLIGMGRYRAQEQDHRQGQHADDVPEQLQPRISRLQSL